MRRSDVLLIVSGLLASCVAQPHKPAAELVADSVPTASQTAYLASIDPDAARRQRQVRTVDLQVKKTSQDSIFAMEIDRSGGAGIAQPIVSADDLFVLLDAGLSGEEARAAIADHDLEIIDAVPQIGALVVNISSRTRLADSTLGSPGELADAAVNKVVRELAADSRFAAVAANSVVTPFSIVSAVTPQFDDKEGVRGELVDWGVTDAKIDKVWPDDERAAVETTVGVIDAGFLDHFDLPIERGLPYEIPVSDHGNHVTGIMCARHNDGGVRGVLPNCRARISAGAFVLDDVSPIEDPGMIGFYTTFAEFVATVMEFIDANEDAKVINLSLGYNWMPNFAIDPRDDDRAAIRDLVRAQGLFFYRILVQAKRKDIAIVSAAGNDSSDLAAPLEAKWASPFNFAVDMMNQRDDWTNALVVEAHDSLGNRASFSNVGGSISCPGVGVLSTVARPHNGIGKMSGTSMASPYCAGALALLRSLRPDLSLRQAIECMLASPEKIDDRVPRLDLEFAVTQCAVS